MKTIRIFLSIILLALAITSSGQLSIKERLLSWRNPQVTYYSAVHRSDQSQVEPWMFDLHTWKIEMIPGADPDHNAGPQSSKLKKAETVIESELAVETWMTVPFTINMQENEISLETWMTAPFESGNEIEIESWMTTSWI